MPGPILTTQSAVQCPHGGQAILTTTSTRVTAEPGAPALLESDVHPVAGCPFTIGPKYSPCVRIEWQGGAAKATIQGVPVLVKSSVGICYSPENAPQGTALITGTQTKASAR